MEIHLARDGSALGIFSESEVREGLAGGRFRLTDLAWRAGMATWTPLAEWPEFAQPALSPSADGFPSPATLAQPAWERSRSFASFFATIRDVILSPFRTFDALPPGDVGRVISFQYAAALPAAVIGSLLTTAVVLAFSSFGDQREFAQLQELGPAGALAAICFGLGCVLVLMPLLLFVGAAVIHLLLLPWSPAGGFGQTYRVYGYVNGSFLLPTLVPCLNYIAGLWSFVILVIGLSRVHRLAWWKPLLSLFLVLCCVVFLVLALLGMAGSLARH